VVVTAKDLDAVDRGRLSAQVKEIIQKKAGSVEEFMTLVDELLRSLLRQAQGKNEEAVT
jgi:hypothetical protein